MTLKKWISNWLILWSIAIISMIIFAIIFSIKNLEIQEWYVYLKTNCNVYKLSDYINEIKRNNNEIIKFYTYINSYLKWSDFYHLNNIQINSLQWLLKININILPWLEFNIVLFIFFFVSLIFITIVMWFIVFLSKRYKYKKYYWYYYDMIENIDYYIA